MSITESKSDANVKYQSYSSPLVKISKGDLTKPYINTSGVGNDNYIRFGFDNLFPQLIDQMYFQSPLHSSIIDFQVQSALRGGYEIEFPMKKTGKDKVMELEFYRKVKIDKLLKGVAMDLKMHKRVHFKITKLKNDILKIERVLPSKVRYNKDATKYWISDNWMNSESIKTYDSFEPTYAEKKVVQILSVIDIESSPGQDVYPLDKTVSVFNWCYLDGQSATLQKANIQRSIFGNIVIKKPTNFKSIEEFNEFKKGIETKEGEVTPILLFSADGKENLPEVESFPSNQNDRAFENTDKRIDDKICQAHTINPIIMGIERPGALGSGSDIKESLPIWEENVLKPFKTDIENVINELLYILDIKGSFKLKYSPVSTLKKD